QTGAKERRAKGKGQKAKRDINQGQYRFQLCKHAYWGYANCYVVPKGISVAPVYRKRPIDILRL
ncbi:MAG: hypothetical protein KAT65_00470, partial [Methanophagales archaeon]|nr:hypothetical protein [Methanophagales archaeon]